MEYRLPCDCIALVRFGFLSRFLDFFWSYYEDSLYMQAKQVFKDGKEVACSWNDKAIHSPTNLEAWLVKINNADQVEALKSDAGHFAIRDGENILAINNKYAAKVYTLLQKADVSYDKRSYNPDFFSKITTEEQFDKVVHFTQDKYLSCPEARQVVGLDSSISDCY